MQKDTISPFVEINTGSPISENRRLSPCCNVSVFQTFDRSKLSVIRPRQKKLLYNEAKVTGIYFVSGHGKSSVKAYLAERNVTHFASCL